MLLERLVETSAALAATRSRKEKATLVADLLREAGPDEIAPAVGLLVGEPRQGRIGVGWATVSRVEAPPVDEAGLTVADVDRVLTELAATSGPGSAARRHDLLAELLGRATAAEADYLGRVLTGGLRHGALDGVVIDAVAAAAGVKVALVRRATMLGGDLGDTAVAALTGGADALADIGLVVLRPIQPMLAATSGSPAEALADLGESSVEWKLDGMRVQVHRRGDEVAVFTRNLNDVTHRLPALVEEVRALRADAFVLDGEVMVQGADDRPVAFQETMSRVGRDVPVEDGGSEGADRVVTSFFDVIHLDGRDLIDEPLATRLGILDELVGGLRIPGRVTADPAEAEAVLAEAVGAGHEGVMVKSVDSPYEAGRRGKGWRKVKPVHTLDLVVLGAEWGHGRRTGWLSNLHLGARDADRPDRFVMVGKTFKGLTDELLTWQTERFLELEVRRDGHTVFVRPELVVEIALDGAQASTTYPGGVALRFARVRGYRPDKDPAHADTLDAVRALLHGAD